VNLVRASIAVRVTASAFTRLLQKVDDLIYHLQYEHIHCGLCQLELDDHTFLQHLITVHLLEYQLCCEANIGSIEEHLASEHSWITCPLPDCGQTVHKGRLPNHLFRWSFL
jgi:hypothetical protein